MVTRLGGPLQVPRTGRDHRRGGPAGRYTGLRCKWCQEGGIKFDCDSIARHRKGGKHRQTLEDFRKDFDDFPPPSSPSRTGFEAVSDAELLATPLVDSTLTPSFAAAYTASVTAPAPERRLRSRSRGRSRSRSRTPSRSRSRSRRPKSGRRSSWSHRKDKRARKSRRSRSRRSPSRSPRLRHSRSTRSTKISSSSRTSRASKRPRSRHERRRRDRSSSSSTSWTSQTSTTSSHPEVRKYFRLFLVSLIFLWFFLCGFSSFLVIFVGWCNPFLVFRTPPVVDDWTAVRPPPRRRLRNDPIWRPWHARWTLRRGLRPCCPRRRRPLNHTLRLPPGLPVRPQRSRLTTPTRWCRLLPSI